MAITVSVPGAKVIGEVGPDVGRFVPMSRSICPVMVSPATDSRYWCHRTVGATPNAPEATANGGTGATGTLGVLAGTRVASLGPRTRRRSPTGKSSDIWTALTRTSRVVARAMSTRTMSPARKASSPSGGAATTAFIVTGHASVAVTRVVAQVTGANTLRPRTAAAMATVGVGCAV